MNASDPSCVKVPKYLLEKLALIDRKITKKGRSGKTILNLNKNDNLKRKRIDALKEEAVSKVIDDKVWLPPDDVLNAFEEPENKE